MALKRDDAQQHPLGAQHTRKLGRVVRREHIEHEVAARVRDRQVRNAGHGQRQLRRTPVRADKRVTRDIHAANGGASPLRLQCVQDVGGVISLAAAGVEHVCVSGRYIPPRRRRSHRAAAHNSPRSETQCARPPCADRRRGACLWTDSCAADLHSPAARGHSSAPRRSAGIAPPGAAHRRRRDRSVPAFRLLSAENRAAGQAARLQCPLTAPWPKSPAGARTAGARRYPSACRTRRSCRRP